MVDSARLAHRLARGTAAAMIASTVGGAAVLAAQAAVARGRRYARPEMTVAMRATMGEGTTRPLRMVLLGDASALGVGVNRMEDSLAGQLAELLAAAGGRVSLSSVAVAGARSGDLATQVARCLLGPPPEVAVILIGTQDATHLVSPAEAGAALGAAVYRLRDAGATVVVGTCPDLSAARAMAAPLRHVVGLLGRRIARAQATAGRSAGAAVVDLAARVGPVFRADPGMFCHDEFHPSADGYRVLAHALFPEVATAANLTLQA